MTSLDTVTAAIPTRTLNVGALAVMTDYAGRQIGVRVTHIHEDGTITGRHNGLSAVAPYRIGDIISRDQKYVHPAF